MMGWWRRNSSLWARSPIHRYVQRALRTHGSTLRARCFSKNGSKTAQDKDDGGERPSGLSNLEWMQLQHCRRWKRRLQEDPYRALFGASEDMLAGKGLTNWEWVFKSFPRWMIDEMGMGKRKGGKRDQDISEEKREEEVTGAKASRTRDGGSYPKRVSFTNDNALPTERKPLFSEPSFRSSGGVASPSDPRRVRDQPSRGNSDESDADGTKTQKPPLFRSKWEPIPSHAYSNKSQNQQGNSSSMSQNNSTSTSTPDVNSTVTQDATGRENSFTEEFFADRSKDGPKWRQTALDRIPARSSVNDVTAPRRKTNVPVTDAITNEMPITESHELQGKSQAECRVPSGKGQITVAHSAEPVLESDSSYHGPFITRDELDLSTEQVLRKFLTKSKVSEPHKSITETVEGLPQDDLDMLTASDIRASMGRAKSDKPKMEDSRQKFEEYFQALHWKEKELDPMRLSCYPSQAEETAELDSVTDELAKWLQSGGSVQGSSSRSEDSLSAKISKVIDVGRQSIARLSRDLANDIPALQPLLSRLRATGANIIHINTRDGRWRVQSGRLTNRIQPRTQNAQRRRRNLSDLYIVNKEYHIACKAIDDLNMRMQPSESLKLRLRPAVELLEKNIRLTGMLISGMHLPVNMAKSNQQMPRLSRYIFRFHETQKALLRLVKKSMLAHGIGGRAPDAPETDSPSAGESTNDGGIRRAEGANATLQGEVRAHQTAMRGLSEDVYACPPKPPVRRPSDGPNPMAQSLLRFGGLQPEGLSKEIKVDSQTEEASEKESADKELVKAVKNAHDNMYRHLKMGQRPVGSSKLGASEGCAETSLPAEPESLAETISQTQAHKNGAASPTYRMLKEDDVSPTVTTPSELSTASPKRTMGPPGSMKESSEADEALPTTTLAEISQSTDPITVSAESSSQPSIDQTQPNKLSDQSPLFATSSDTKYTVYTYDPQYDEVILTTSTTPFPAHPLAETLPLHTALATLTHPSKFLPHLPPNSAIVLAKPDLLIVRSTPEPTITTARIAASDPDMSSVKDDADADIWKGINPIDGTTRLSPTGFVGDGLDLEQDFEERRRAAGEYHGRRRVEEERGGRTERKERRGAGVLKTAIVAAATCYVVGVVAEVVR